MAAYWLVKSPIPLGALASSAHQPQPLYWARLSTKPCPPGSSRGGLVGISVKPIRPSMVEVSSQVRISR